MQILNRMKILSILLLTVLVTSCSGKDVKTLQPGEKPKTLVRFATTAGNLPLNFGIKKGYFAEQGIDLKIVTISGGPASVTAAASGEADFGGMGSPILVGIAAGVPITIVASPPHSGENFVLVSKPHYKNFAELKGKVVSPGNVGGGSSDAFLMIAKAKGFKSSDFQLMNAGPSANSLAALQTGRVEAIIASEVVGVKAELEGFGKILEHAVDYFGHYQHSFVFATNSFIKEKPEAVRAFLVAYRKTLEYIKAHPEEAIQFAVTELQQEERSYRKVYEKEIPTWDTTGKVDFVGTDNALKILKELGDINPQVQITAKQIVDERFLTK
ncbi:MAG: ABC transporter substrate-binding protein [Chlorobium sp.]